MMNPAMPQALQDFERHRHATDKLARSVLKLIGKQTGRSYPQTLADFREQDYRTTAAFWAAIEQTHPGKFNQVEYCSGCRAFHLWLDPSIEG